MQLVIFDVKGLSKLIDKIGSLSIQQATHILGPDAFTYETPMSEERAIACVMAKYVVEVNDFKIVNYNDRQNNYIFLF